jgi:methionyl-tRNA formyltransferase
MTPRKTNSPKIQILVDNQKSWIVPYCQDWLKELSSTYPSSALLFRHEDVVSGDILVLLSCEKKFKHLSLNSHNLVVHESDLPEGKGWSPLSWQVIEGKDRIPVTLIGAAEEIDAGPIYDQEWITLAGNELVQELRLLQFSATRKLLERFFAAYPNVSARPQEGEGSFYPKRTPQDSELSTEKSIAEQFDLLRVVDNDRYPAFFFHRGKKFIIRISRGES